MMINEARGNRTVFIRFRFTIHFQFRLVFNASQVIELSSGYADRTTGVPFHFGGCWMRADSALVRPDRFSFVILTAAEL